MSRIQTKRLWVVYVKPNRRDEKVHSFHNNKRSADVTAKSAPLTEPGDWHGDFRVQEHPGADLPVLLGR